MKVLAIIPARGGSKGIPLKNIALVAGRPLLHWTLDAALGCAQIGRTVVSTDHPDIRSRAEQVGAEVVDRPAALSQDGTATLPVLRHAWEQIASGGYRADLVVTLQPTSPLREARHLSDALALFMRYPEADSLVSVQKVPHQFVPESLMLMDGDWGHPTVENPILRRQDKANVWARNGAAIYITRQQCLDDFVWGGRTLVYPMNKIASIDIDDAEDLAMADALLRRRTCAEGQKP